MAWWTRLFRRKHTAFQAMNTMKEWPDERELMLALHTLKSKVEQAQEDHMLDHEIYNECRHLLFRLDLLLPYAILTPPVLQERIIRLIAEDTPGIIHPYLSLEEESKGAIRRDFLYALRCMGAETKRIVGTIQECEKEALANQAAFIAKWYGKK